MKRLPMAQRVAVVSAFFEGNSLRTTVRMTGVAKNTVVRLLAELGAACSAYQASQIRNLTSERIQCEEIWSFGHPDAGEAWTWTAIDADTKLCVSYFVGSRGVGSAYEFMSDVSTRLKSRVQLRTDQHRVCLTAVEDPSAEVDYAQLTQLYTPATEAESCHRPPKYIGEREKVLPSGPDSNHIRTFYVERPDLTMRMSMRWFTRPTNAFSRKLQNHTAAISLYFMYYNFGRLDHTLRVTPAMKAGVASHVWTIEEIVRLLE